MNAPASLPTVAPLQPATPGARHVAAFARPVVVLAVAALVAAAAYATWAWLGGHDHKIGRAHV